MATTNPKPKPERPRRYTLPEVLILLSLAGADEHDQTHTRGLSAALPDRTHGRFPLDDKQAYKAAETLEAARLIEPTGEATNGKRRPLALTHTGEAAAAYICAAFQNLITRADQAQRRRKEREAPPGQLPLAPSPQHLLPFGGPTK